MALLLGVLPFEAQAGAGNPGYATIELRGSKSAHVDVRFDEPTKITCCTDPVSSDEKARVAPLTVRTRGTYAGYVIERLSDGKIVAGALRVPAMDWDPFNLPLIVRVKGSRAVLAPGGYRIHLVTDGASTVRFRVNGLDDNASYRPTRPTPVSSSFKTPEIEAGQPASHHSTPVHVNEDTLVIVASLLVAEGSQAAYLEHCVVQIFDLCQRRHDHSSMVTLSPNSLESLSRIYSVYMPGHFAPGEWDAKFTAASAGVVKIAQTLVLTMN